MPLALRASGLRIVRRRAARPGYAVATDHLRASWLDPRLCGDAWIVGNSTQATFLMFNRYPLAQIQSTPFDVASLNQTILRMRQRGVRRCCARAG